MIELQTKIRIGMIVMKLSQVLIVSMSLLLTSGCSDSSYSNSQDLCNDRASNVCANVARTQCGLTSTSSDSALAACRPFAECEDAAFDACMAEND